MNQGLLYVLIADAGLMLKETQMCTFISDLLILDEMLNNNSQTGSTQLRTVSWEARHKMLTRFNLCNIIN